MPSTGIRVRGATCWQWLRLASLASLRAQALATAVRAIELNEFPSVADHLVRAIEYDNAVALMPSLRRA